jgi:hypothetical protein
MRFDGDECRDSSDENDNDLENDLKSDTTEAAVREAPRRLLSTAHVIFYVSLAVESGVGAASAVAPPNPRLGKRPSSTQADVSEASWRV